LDDIKIRARQGKPFWATANSCHFSLLITNADTSTLLKLHFQVSALHIKPTRKKLSARRQEHDRELIKVNKPEMEQQLDFRTLCARLLRSGFHEQILPIYIGIIVISYRHADVFKFTMIYSTRHVYRIEMK